MAGVGQSLCSGLHLRMHVHDGQLFGLHGLDETGRCVDQALTCELDAHRPIRFGAPAHRPRKLPRRGAVDSGQFELSLEPARWPWTTLRVAHRARLCPLAHSLPPRLSNKLRIKLTCLL
jgi:hypothetical protein